MKANISLSDLSPQAGSRSDRKRVGRGIGSGQGKTAGKGHKGQKARKGSSVKLGFEGGQTPLYRRLPKRGFSAPAPVKGWECLSLSRILTVLTKDGETIDLSFLKTNKLVKNNCKQVKVIGKSELKYKISLSVAKVTKGVRESVEKAGGKIEETS
jgi:large subunit ribosomal protein L15